jgi:hypothetical protein
VLTDPTHRLTPVGNYMIWRVWVRGPSDSHGSKHTGMHFLKVGLSAFRSYPTIHLPVGGKGYGNHMIWKAWAWCSQSHLAVNTHNQEAESGSQILCQPQGWCSVSVVTFRWWNLLLTREGGTSDHLTFCCWSFPLLELLCRFMSISPSPQPPITSISHPNTVVGWPILPEPWLFLFKLLE